MQIGLLWPSFALVALIFAVFLVMFQQRVGLMKRTPPRAEDFATSEAALRYFEPVEMPANNYRNLFEMPVLYFALAPLLLITHQASYVQIVLAWAFVLLRMLHSFIHIVPKKVTPRFIAYLGSVAVLSAMWIGYFIDMLRAASLLAAAG